MSQFKDLVGRSEGRRVTKVKVIDEVEWHLKWAWKLGRPYARNLACMGNNVFASVC